jgi:adenosylcobinamide kinase / adenosylcobinamide-phosphate guanylyltransferase
MGKRLTLILGGARSGKSALALRMAAGSPDRKVLFVATAAPGDGEMAKRIALHRADRPVSWHTLEAQTHIADAIRQTGDGYDVVLIDCITLLAANALAALPESAEAETAEALVCAEIDGALAAYAASRAEWIVVSNEVGLGVVPSTPLGRLYRDSLGRANQRLAARADEVLFLVAGLPMRIKPGSPVDGVG